MRRNTFLEALAESARNNTFVHVILFVIALAVALLGMLGALPAFGAVPDAARGYQRQYTRILHSEWGLDAPVSTLAGQIAQESGFDCRAVSRVGARGCAQFMPATAKWIGDVDHSLANGDMSSPAWAFRAQAVYMKWLAARITAANACERMGFALQAYNSGLGWVQKRQRLAGEPGRCFDAACNVNPGVTPANQREAQEYPDRIERRWAPQFRAAGWGSRSCAA